MSSWPLRLDMTRASYENLRNPPGKPMGKLRKTYGNYMKTYGEPMEPQWKLLKPMKTYENPMKIYENHMKTYESPMQKPMNILWKFWVFHCTLRGAKRRGEQFQCFYCILRGAKRRGEKIRVFTVYYAQNQIKCGAKRRGFFCIWEVFRICQKENYTWLLNTSGDMISLRDFN